MNRLPNILKLLAATLLLVSAPGAFAQAVRSTPESIVLTAQVTEGLAVTLSSHNVDFNLMAGNAINAGSQTITATTSWNSKAGRDVQLFAFFTSSTAALSNGAGTGIPAANFQVGFNGGPLTAPNMTIPGSGVGSALQMFSLKVTGLNKTGSRTDAMNFNINLSTLPLLPAGTYTGTLFIRAQVI